MLDMKILLGACGKNFNTNITKTNLTEKLLNTIANGDADSLNNGKQMYSIRVQYSNQEQTNSLIANNSITSLPKSKIREKQSKQTSSSVCKNNTNKLTLTNNQLNPKQMPFFSTQLNSEEWESTSDNKRLSQMTGTTSCTFDAGQIGVGAFIMDTTASEWSKVSKGK